MAEWKYIKLSEVKFHAPPFAWRQRDGHIDIGGISPWEPYTAERLKDLDEEFERRREENRKLRAQLTTKNFTIASNTDPTKSYQVTQHTDGSWSCTCKGFEFRRSCSHIEKMKGWYE